MFAVFSSYTPSAVQTLGSCPADQPEVSSVLIEVGSRELLDEPGGGSVSEFPPDGVSSIERQNVRPYVSIVDINTPEPSGRNKWEREMGSVPSGGCFHQETYTITVQTTCVITLSSRSLTESPAPFRDRQFTAIYSPCMQTRSFPRISDWSLSATPVPIFAGQKVIITS